MQQIKGNPHFTNRSLGAERELENVMDLWLTGLAAMIALPFYLGMRLGGAWKEEQLRAVILAIQQSHFVVHENDRVVKEIIVTDLEKENGKK